MKKIIYPEKNLEDYGFKKTDKKCPICGEDLVYGPAPCPEGKVGCLVIHYACRCFKCVADFQDDNTP